MKHKYILQALAVTALTAGLTACSDSFFELDNPNSVSETTFWQTENDALMGLTACYDALQNGNLYNDNVDGWCFGFLMREIQTDNGFPSWGDWMLGSGIPKGTSSTNEECFRFYWNANYELIKRCNVMIKNVDRINMDEAGRDAFKAEAIALRALGYCNLISTFRDVPYLTAPLTITEAKAAKTSKAEIAKSLIADMKANVPNLPTVGSQAKGRMTREAGYAILGRIALFTENWDEAIAAYSNVIGKVQLFKAGDGSDYTANYRQLFTPENENASEVLLSVHYTGPGLGEGQTFGVCWGGPMNAIEATANLCDDYYCTDGKPISESPLFQGSLDPNKPAEYDLARYENRDPRLKATLFLPGMEWNGKVLDKIPASSNACILKWYIPENTANEYDGNMDYYIIRYAEVLLSMAEAKIEKGASQSEVTSLINEVRARVGMPSVETAEGTGLSQEQLRQIVRHERRIELAFEDLRFADLYRWGDWKNAVARKQADYDHGFCSWFVFNYRGAKDDVWPIPQSEIDTNDQLIQHDEWK